MVEFEAELDLYEREAAWRVGAFAAREARREMGAHLAAEYEARLEMGVSPEEARGQTLRAMGDLRGAARAEDRSLGRLFALSAVWGASLLMLGSWFVPVLSEGGARLACTLWAAGWTVTGAVAGTRGGPLRWGGVERALAVLPAVLTFLAYVPGLGLSLPGWLIFGAIPSAAVLALAAGVRAGRTAWGACLLGGGAIFFAQSAGVELSAWRDGAHIGYPLDVTVGTWLAFTLPLLVVSALGAGVGAGVRRVRARGVRA